MSLTSVTFHYNFVDVCFHAFPKIMRADFFHGFYEKNGFRILQGILILSIPSCVVGVFLNSFDEFPDDSISRPLFMCFLEKYWN